MNGWHREYISDSITELQDLYHFLIVHDNILNS